MAYLEAVLLGRQLLCAASVAPTRTAATTTSLLHTLHHRSGAPLAPTQLLSRPTSTILNTKEPPLRAQGHSQLTYSKLYSTSVFQRVGIDNGCKRYNHVSISNRLMSSAGKPKLPTNNQSDECDVESHNMQSQEIQNSSRDNVAFQNNIREGNRDNIEANGRLYEDEEVDFEELVKMEVELRRQVGIPTPSSFPPEKWQELLAIPSRSARSKYLNFLFKREMVIQNDEKRKQERRVMNAQRLEEKKQEDAENKHIVYGLWNNSMFMRIRKSTIIQFYHNKVMQAMMFGQTLVFDMGFDDHMTYQERQNLAYQIQLLMSYNRSHREPYHIHLCNVSEGSDSLRRLIKFIPPLLKPEYPLTVSQESYLDKYPGQRLVYLTPDARQEMREYDHEAVYIIGGIVDKSPKGSLTLSKAKREGVIMQRLPLDRYIDWSQGGKCLTLDQVTKILLDVKLTGDWKFALRHIPSRKIRTPEEREEIEEDRRIKLKPRKRRMANANYVLSKLKMKPKDAEV